MEAKNTEKNITLQRRVEELEKKLSGGLSDYLSQNGQIVIDLVMRVAALERILVEKGIFKEEEIQKQVGDTYAELAAKAAKAEAKGN